MKESIFNDIKRISLAPLNINESLFGNSRILKNWYPIKNNFSVYSLTSLHNYDKTNKEKKEPELETDEKSIKNQTLEKVQKYL